MVRVRTELRKVKMTKKLNLVRREFINGGRGRDDGPETTLQWRVTPEIKWEIV